MNHPLRHFLPLLGCILALGVAAQPTTAQISTSFGGGFVTPHDDLDDAFDDGVTARVQASLSLLGLVQGQLQGGWTHFDSELAGLEDADIYHLAAGARVSPGFVFIGANVGVFFGDDPAGSNGVGFLPEAGIAIGPIEIAVDSRVDGDARWTSVRGAVRF